MSRFSRVIELLLPIGLLMCLVVVLAPLPSGVLDLLLMANLALSLIVLLTTIQVGTPLEFSVFPTVLLATTLGRLVLNIGTTRLILTRAADHGLDAAGGVIRSFGEFVAGDQVLVGIVLFSIIAVIQFVVITKGATRISEVSARFALDGMPGKQMAVDADLNSGAIDETEAQLRRAEIARQADFFGAMDGASKFVRGDAIASVFITLINIVGGMVLGVVGYGMTPFEASTVFTKLTIGDGLISQLPALLISLAAAMLVTRGKQRTSLSTEFFQQLISKPQVLAVAGGFLGLLVLTQLPTLPLLMLGGGCLGAAVVLSRHPFPDQDAATAAPTPVSHAANKSQGSTPRRAPQAGASTKRDEEKAAAVGVAETRIEELLSVDPVELELGLKLVRLADASRGGTLLNRIAQLRQAIVVERGLVLPKVRIRDNLRLDENQYRIKIQGNPVASFMLDPGYVWMIGPVPSLPTVGERVNHPAFGQPLLRVSPADRNRVSDARLQPLDASEVLLQHLRYLVRQHAAELLTRDAAKHLIDETRRQSPAVVDELIPGVMKLADVQRVLRQLLSEGISIRQLSTILETLGDEAPQTRSEVDLVEKVRQRLARSISAQYRDRRDRLHVVTLAAELEAKIKARSKIGHRDVSVDLRPGTIDTLCRAIDDQLSELRESGRPEILLVRTDIRPFVSKLTDASLSNVIVLSYAEVSSETKVVSLGIVSSDEV